MKDGARARPSGFLLDGWTKIGPTRIRLEYEADDTTIPAARAAIARFEAAGPTDADREELIRAVAAKMRDAIETATSFLIARAASLEAATRRAEAARKIAAGKARAAAARAAAANRPHAPAALENPQQPAKAGPAGKPPRARKRA